MCKYYQGNASVSKKGCEWLLTCRRNIFDLQGIRYQSRCDTIVVVSHQCNWQTRLPNLHKIYISIAIEANTIKNISALTIATESSSRRIIGSQWRPAWLSSVHCRSWCCVWLHVFDVAWYSRPAILIWSAVLVLSWSTVSFVWTHCCRVYKRFATKEEVHFVIICHRTPRRCFCWFHGG